MPQPSAAPHPQSLRRADSGIGMRIHSFPPCGGQECGWQIPQFPIDVLPIGIQLVTQTSKEALIHYSRISGKPPVLLEFWEFTSISDRRLLLNGWPISRPCGSDHAGVAFQARSPGKFPDQGEGLPSGFCRRRRCRCVRPRASICGGGRRRRGRRRTRGCRCGTNRWREIANCHTNYG